MAGVEEEIAALERQLAEAKKRLEIDQTRRKGDSRPARIEAEALDRQRIREERRKREEEEARRKQAVEDEESTRMLEQLALSEMKLSGVKRAREAVGTIYKQRLAEINTINHILDSRERKYKQLLEGRTTTADQVDSQMTDGFRGFDYDMSNTLPEERKQIMEELLKRRQEELAAALDQRRIHAEALQEKKKVESERLAQYRYSHGLSFSGNPSTPDIDMNTRVKETERDVRRTRLRIMQLKKEVEQSRSKQANDQSNWYNGELGPSSYQPWQMEDYYMVHSIVLDIIDCAVRDATAVIWSEAIDLDTQELLWETEKRKLESNMKMHQVMREAQSTAASITDMVIELECTAIAREFVKLCHSSDKFINSLLITAIQDICATDSDHVSLVKSSHTEMKKTRRKTLDIYRHTQIPFVRIGSNETAATQQITEFDTDEDDVTVLDFLHLRPIHLSHLELSDDELQYKRAEAMYWQNLEPSVSLFSLPDVVKGILSTAVDPSERFIALGSDNGIIVVMDLCYHPPLSVRLYLPTKSPDKVPIEELTWSLDSSRLLSLNSKGVIQLWSMSGHYSNNTKKEASDFSHSAASGYFPCHLENLMSLMPQDFVFIEGPFAGSKHDNTPAPTTAVFHPAVTLLGTQNWFVVAFSDGDILKVNSDESLIDIRHNRVNTEMTMSRIGQNLQAELFRGHRCSVSSIGFVRHTAQMVSVDIKSHVFVWNYDRSLQTGFGWFIPARKYRVDMAEQVYKPAYGHSVKTLFSDTKQLAGHRKQTVQQRERARQLAKQMIESLPEPPWHTKQDKDFVVKIYSPDDVLASGETFHIVTLHHSDGDLSEYATQMYKPAKNVATQLISAKITPSGQDIAFMFLYPEFNPKLPHITVVTLSIESFAFRSVRIDVPMTQQQHDDCVTNPVCSMAVSRVFDISRSDYIVLNISGKLLGYSLATGSLLLSGGQEEYFMSGCELKGKMATVPRHSVIQLAHHTTCIKFVASSRGSSTLHIFQLDDRSTKVSKQILWQASHEGMLRILRNCPPAFRARSHHWTIDGSCFMSPEGFARQLLDEMVSLAVTYGDRLEDTETRNSQLNDEPPGNDELSGHMEEDGLSQQSGGEEEREQEEVEGERTSQLVGDEEREQSTQRSVNGN